MARDKSRLPFEIMREEGKEAQKRQSEGGKKRVEVFVSPEKLLLSCQRSRK